MLAAKSSITPKGTGYRPDIDGLRAVSIVCVLLFHFPGRLIPGGYIGVDVFFVISGYLITRLILAEVAVEKFSLIRFYSRRIRRLFPALLFTVVATFVAAALWFPADLLWAEARDVLATIGSVSNFHFWRESHKYFSQNINYSPLLHTWSLSVAEQFYLLWSIALLGFARLKKVELILPTMIAGAILSVAASQYWVTKDPLAAFYWTPSRIFELSIGGICVWLDGRHRQGPLLNTFLFALGLGCIAYAAFFFAATTPFPGLHGLVPCIGAALVICSGQNTPIAVALNNRVAVGIGLVSYSLYLCHWPIFVFAEYIFGPLQSLLAAVILGAISFAVAALMYVYIETPFRRTKIRGLSVADFIRLLAVCGALTAPVVIAATTALQPPKKSWAWRLDPAQRQFNDEQTFGWFPCSPAADQCEFGDRDGPTTLEIIADSHAAHLVAAFQPLLVQRGENGKILAPGGCLILPGVHNVRLVQGCDTARRDSLRHFANDRVPIVISEAWLEYHPRESEGHLSSAEELANVYRKALEETFIEFHGAGRRFVVFAPQVPHNCDIDEYRLRVGPLPHAPQHKCSDFVLSVDPAAKEFNEMLESFRKAHADTVTIIDPMALLCDEAKCPIVRNGLFFYIDVAHLSVAGGQYLAAKGRPVFERILNSSGRQAK